MILSEEEREYRRLQAREYRKKHPERMKEYSRKRGEKIRAKVFNAYGGFICACCKITHPDFLTLDHVENNGRSHRRELGYKSSYQIYLWAIRNNFPKGLQVLCWNCNMGKRKTGVCPHEQVV